MKIFVIGNGESRKDFNLNSLTGKGIIIGCNAIYRDMKPHILVAMDGKYENKSCDYGMIKEIRENCNFLKDVIFVWRDRIGDKLRDIRLVIENNVLSGTMYEDEVLNKKLETYDEGWASGPTGLYAALQHIFPFHFIIDGVYLIGFDLSRLPNGKGNSMYKGTNNYIPIQSTGATHNTSAEQLKKCFNRYKDVDFYRVIQDINNIPKQWYGCTNVKNITYEDFENGLHK